MIYFVAAHDRNFGIGSKNKPLPWPLMPGDKSHLHELADGKHIVLGERTYRDYKNIQVAFNTKNVTVISRALTVLADATVTNSLDEILQQSKNEDMWVIGGGSIFKQLLPYVDTMHLTRIEGEFDANVYFPEYSFDDWSVNEEHHAKDVANPYSYTFLTLTKKRKPSSPYVNI